MKAIWVLIVSTFLLSCQDNSRGSNFDSKIKDITIDTTQDNFLRHCFMGKPVSKLLAYLKLDSTRINYPDWYRTNSKEEIIFIVYYDTNFEIILTTKPSKTVLDKVKIKYYLVSKLILSNIKIVPIKSCSYR